MCLAVPMKIVECEGEDGQVELGGVRRTISLALLSEAQVGDFVLVHAGYALTVIDAEEAARTLAMLEELKIDPEDEA